MNSFISWVGAKTKLAQEIVSYFPSHKGYCEVFGGGGSVLFYKDPSPAEIYNDINSELVNLFRVVRDNGDELNHEIKWSVSSREEFERYLSMTPEEIQSLPPVKRALRYYYIVKNAFGSNPAGGSFSSCQTVPIRWDSDASLAKWRSRLSKVTVENLPFEKLISKYDHPDLLFYCLPSTQEVILEDFSHIKIGDLEPGMMLYNGSEVTNKCRRSAKEEILEISCMGSSSVFPIQLSKDHKMLVMRGESFSWVKAENLTTEDYLVISPNKKCRVDIPSLSLYSESPRGKEVIFSLDLKSLSKLIGYFLAEGHYQNGLIFSFSRLEKEYHEEICNLSKKIFGIDAAVYEGSPHDSVTSVHIQSVVAERIMRAFVSGERAQSKKIKKEVMFWTAENQMEILKGWMNGDGGIWEEESNDNQGKFTRTGRRNKRKLTGTTTSRELAFQLYYMSLRCHLLPCIKTRCNKKKYYKGREISTPHPVYDVYFSDNWSIQRFTGEDYGGRCCSRRRWVGDNLITPITSIKKIPYSGDMIDISCSESREFNLAGGMRCHNCDPPYYIAEGKRYYEFDFGEKEHQSLFDSLKDIKGKFLISYDDVPEVRELYKDFNIKQTEPVVYTLAKTDRSEKRELIITNYDIENTSGQMRLFV